MSDLNPSPATGTATAEAANPFTAIARLLRLVRESLEGIKRQGQAPRWVRIARIRAYQKDGDHISRAVIPAVDQGLIYAVLYLAGLTLKARDLLTTADAATAAVEVGGEMLRTITTDDFNRSLSKVIGDDGAVNPLRAAGAVIEGVMDLADKVPEPEDLDQIDEELYALLCLKQLPLDEKGLGATTETHVDLATSGKLRLLAMALARPIAIRSLGKDKSGEQEVTFLGGRRLWPVAEAALPNRAEGRWGAGEDSETIYEFAFSGADSAAGLDIAEANGLLEKMGYVEPAVTDATVFDALLQRRLRRFQKVNGLTVNGQLDNPTLNRLMHLNVATTSLKWAKPFDAGALPEGFDDTRNDAG
ncbi:MAG: peptidoglycan-binding protein [Candidatus Accumulibacter meliphilus]|jgi:hypothetical protein|uniref:Peptidoglycan-binding protein n=1 Tax=Candidatus Accumulibacter meliphilus TaxID=2211374 RepID=A0A369XXT1_9PROT|nr:MAG: peptidoglycan-binding protein [Candidatus Accumulibacter meliphilus]